MIVGMLDYALSPDQLAELRQAHRRTRDKREADRIKAVVLLATGWTAEAVAEVLLVETGQRRTKRRYGSLLPATTETGRKALFFTLPPCVHARICRIHRNNPAQGAPCGE